MTKYEIFQPLLKRDFLRLLWETNSLLDRTRPLASRCVKRGRLGDDILRAWWNEVWAVLRAPPLRRALMRMAAGGIQGSAVPGR